MVVRCAAASLAHSLDVVLGDRQRGMWPFAFLSSSHRGGAPPVASRDLLLEPGTEMDAEASRLSMPPGGMGLGW